MATAAFALNLDMFEEQSIHSQENAGRRAGQKSPSVRTAVLLFVFTIMLLLVTEPDIGLTWDEPIYIEAAEIYIEWIYKFVRDPSVALSIDEINSHWGFNNEHPPINKVWSGLVWAVTKDWLDVLTAHRLGNILLTGLLISLLYYWVAQGYGQIPGLFSAAVLLFMPRFFFHAHLAALDVPVTVMLFLAIFITWQSINLSGWRWALILGVMYGLALGTKINAFAEVPLILGSWILIFHRRRSIYIRVALAGVLGFLVWMLLWPWLYHDTLSRIAEYLQFMTLGHYNIEQYYLGRWYSPPPWHFPFVMTILVVPFTVVLLAGIGSLWVVIRGRQQPLGWLFFVSALVPMLILASGWSQVFDNGRLLMPSFPFIAALAGVGLSRVSIAVGQIKSPNPRADWTVLPIVILVLLAIAPQLVRASLLYPHLLSYYSELIGGLPGAKRLGMETTYWAETYSEALPYLNLHAPYGAMVWVEAHDVMLYYQKMGRLRGDLLIAGPRGNESIVKNHQGYRATIAEADIIVVEFRESGFSNDIINLVRNKHPVYQLGFQEIPLLAIYTN